MNMSKIDVDKLVAREERRLARKAERHGAAKGMAAMALKLFEEHKGRCTCRWGHIVDKCFNDISFSASRVSGDGYRFCFMGYVAEQAPVIFEEFGGLDIPYRVYVTVTNGGRTHRQRTFGPDRDDPNWVEPIVIVRAPLPTSDEDPFSDERKHDMSRALAMEEQLATLHGYCEGGDDPDAPDDWGPDGVEITSGTWPHQGYAPNDILIQYNPSVPGAKEFVDKVIAEWPLEWDQKIVDSWINI